MKRQLLLCSIVCFLPFFSVGCEKEEGTTYHINGTYTAEDKTFRGTLDLTYYNDTGNSLNTLAFQLYGNAYREGAKNQPISAAYHSAYYDKIDYGSMEISSVSAESWTIGGEDDTLLTVEIPTLVNGETYELSIDFCTTLAKVDHRLGVGRNGVNLANFYPILCVYDEGWQECPYTMVGDPFLSEVASYVVEVSFPANYEVASSGKQTVTTKGNQKTVKSEGKLRDFALVLSDRWKVSTATVGDTEIVYYSMGENAEDYLDVAKRSFAFYQEKFGKYPLPTLSIVETDFPFGGMEYAGLCMLNHNLERETMRYAIAHEIAHEWWYEGVGSDQRNSAWMDEGLAEYSCVLFFEQGDEVYTREGVVVTAKRAIRSYVSVYSQLFGKVNTSPERNNREFVSEYEYTNLVYNQGILLFDSLRESIGDQKFMDGLRRYYERFCGEIAMKDDLISCFQATGVDVNGLFQSFLSGKAII